MKWEFGTRKQVGSQVNRSMNWRLFKCRWSDEGNRIVHVTETVNGVDGLTAHVHLNDGSVEIIGMDATDSSDTVSPIDQHRILQRASEWERWQRRSYPKHIRWHEDGMKFETLRESQEWASSVVYNEIGNLYDGYLTEDEHD